MKKLSYLLLATCLMTFTSCIDIVEEMFLKKDGSGKYVMTIDMSGIMKDGMQDMLKGFGEEAMEEATDEVEGEVESKEEEVKIPTEVDSIMHMKYAPDSIKSRFDNPAFLDKVKIHTVMSESQEKMLFEFILDFDDMADIDYFLANFDKLQGEGMGGKGLPMSGGGGGGLLPTSMKDFNLFKYSKKLLVRNVAPSGAETIPEDELGMMKMFFGSGTYKTIYHLPGKVKKTDIEGGQIDGKTLTSEYQLMDIIEGKKKIDGSIKFK